MIDVAHEEMLFFLALLAFSNVYQEAAGVGEFSAAEARVGADEDMPDCPILRAQAYRVLDKLFVAGQAHQRSSSGQRGTRRCSARQIHPAHIRASAAPWC